jgi:hypothetical protein
MLRRIGVAHRSSLLLAFAVAAFGGGCAARVYSSEPAYPASVDDSVVYVDTAPINIETYPHYYYGDGYAYYVDGRWYRRGARGWGYYRQEPPELERQRVHVQQAPDAPRERPYVQQAPEPSRERPYVQQAPEPSRERPYVRPAPEVTRERPAAQPAPGTAVPNRGAAEAQPRRDEPRRDVQRAAPPPAQKRPSAPHEDHAAPQREQRGP